MSLHKIQRVDDQSADGQHNRHDGDPTPDMQVHRFSEQYEKQFKANLIKYFGAENAEIILQSREETREKLDEGLLEEPKLEETGHPVQSYTSMSASEGEKKKRGGLFSRWGFKPWQKAAVSIAGIMLVLVIGGALTMSVDALRVPIIRFFSEDRTIYNIVKAEPDTKGESSRERIEHTYVPGKIMEGYEEISRQAMERLIIINYNNQEGKLYRFFQSLGSVENWLNFEDMPDPSGELSCGESYYYYNEEKNWYNMIWSFDGYVFRISGDLSQEEMIELADSLTYEK